MSIKDNTTGLQEILETVNNLPQKEILGGDTDIEDAIVTRDLTTYTNDRVTIIGDYAFAHCTSLTSVNLPNCTFIGNFAFSQCSDLTSINFPTCSVIYPSAFHSCIKLTSISFPTCYGILSNAFERCSALASVNLSDCHYIYSAAFSRCYNLSQIYLMGSTLCTLANSNAFIYTPYTGYSNYFSGTPYIYVPSSLLTSYQTATNWAYFSSYFKKYVNLFTFSVGGELHEDFQAEEGMTWREWIGSKYNTTVISCTEQYVYYHSTVLCAEKNYSYVHPDDIIKSDISYIFIYD